MFADFPQIVPQKICLSCQGCCRYKEAESFWRPRIAFEELKGNEYKLDLIGALGKAACINTVAEKGQNRCSFLDLKTNKCGVYTGRPFECRLYPFLLTSKNGRVAVSVHLSCPYVQGSRHSPEFEQHVGVLKEYLSGEAQTRFLKNNPELPGDYSEYKDEIEELFTL
ncbi:MAG: YkgJ family cysteine cluster protein [Candidatus Omnitrophica bacterium]|nr:YkgJ family cysteine cluster protein [Candidatus Omnitrophota bacterium]